MADSGFTALGSKLVEEKIANSEYRAPSELDLSTLPAQAKYERPRSSALIGGSTKASNAAGVVVSFPLAQLGQSFLFGGVITGVSNSESEQLGGLKLSGISTDDEQSDLTPNSDTGLFPSPECNNSDGGIDAFGYHVSSLSKAYSLLLSPSLKTASPWKSAQLQGRMGTYLRGALSYYFAAPDTFAQWTNWTGKAGLPVRPLQADKAQTYVLQKVSAAVCDVVALEEGLNQKDNAESVAATKKELKAHFQFVNSFLTEQANIDPKLLPECAEAAALVE
jgi:hypothetical protein